MMMMITRARYDNTYIAAETFRVIDGAKLSHKVGQNREITRSTNNRESIIVVGRVGITSVTILLLLYQAVIHSTL